jgi:hypothetical protein
MGYVIAGILVVLIVAAGIAFFMRSAMNRKGQATIAAPDEGTPLGDTAEHAGEHSEEGRTVSDPEGRSRDDGTTDPNPGVGGRGQGGVGGEGEGSRPGPDSERLANRPR